jgi:hypothetical protein
MLANDSHQLMHALTFFFLFSLSAFCLDNCLQVLVLSGDVVGCAQCRSRFQLVGVSCCQCAGDLVGENCDQCPPGTIRLPNNQCGGNFILHARVFLPALNGDASNSLPSSVSQANNYGYHFP